MLKNIHILVACDMVHTAKTDKVKLVSHEEIISIRKPIPKMIIEIHARPHIETPFYINDKKEQKYKKEQNKLRNKHFKKR